MLARITIWWVFFRISVEERLVYRGDFALGTLMRFLPIVTQIFLWYAIFESVAGNDLQSGPEPESSSSAVQKETTPVALSTPRVKAQEEASGGNESGNSLSQASSDDEARGEADAPDEKAASVNGERLEEAATEKRIEQYTFHDMVAYYLLAMLARAFSSMPGLTTGIALQIRNGEVKKFLVQPVDMLGCLLLQRIAHKLVYYVIAAAPFAFVFYLCRDYFDTGWPAPEVFACFLASLIMAFLLGYFIEACMGLVGFWFLEVTSLTFAYMLLNFFLSGHMFPLEILPSEPINIRALVDVLPLKYLAYFPAAVFLGKVEGADLTEGMIVQVCWLGLFIVLARVMWWRGVKRYSGFGG